MLGFAQDTATCRKILFAQYDLFVLILGDCNTEKEAIRYFQMSSNIGMNAWSTEEEVECQAFEANTTIYALNYTSSRAERWSYRS